MKLSLTSLEVVKQDTAGAFLPGKGVTSLHTTLPNIHMALKVHFKIEGKPKSRGCDHPHK